MNLLPLQKIEQMQNNQEEKMNMTSSPELYLNIILHLKKDESIIKQPILFHENSNKVAVIVDPRFDDLMECVIRNFMYYMNPKGWNLMIMSYFGHEKKIKEKFPNCLFKKINNEDIFFDKEENPNISIHTYNKIFMSSSFWNSIPFEKIAIFQKDCIMFKMFEEYFIEFYDYSGANFHVTNDISYLYGGINGGFSLRNKRAMLECIEKLSWEKIEEYRQKMYSKDKYTKINKKNEDVFFTHACEILLKNVPDKFHRALLAIESDICINTSVYHGWNKPYQPIEIALNMLVNSSLFSKYISVKKT